MTHANGAVHNVGSTAGLTRIASRNLAVRHAAALGLNLAGSVVLAKELGPASWGTYAAGLTALTIGQQAVERGASGFIIQRPKPLDEAEVATTFAIQLGVGALACGILIGLGLWLGVASAESGLTTLIDAVGFAILIYAIRAVPLGRLERSFSYGRVAGIEVADVLTFNAAAVLAVVLGFGIVGVAVATVFRASFSTAIALAVGRTAAGRPVARLLPAELLRFAIPFTGSNILTYVNTLAAPILVAGTVGFAEFGVLQLAYTILVYPQTVTTIASRVGFAAYSRMAPAAIAAAASRYTGALIRLVASSTLILAVTSAYWVVPIFGGQWVAMPVYMLAIAPTYAMGANFNLIIAALNARAAASVVLLLTAAFSAIYWLSAALLIPRIGGLGLPIAYSLASLSYTGYLVAARRRIGTLDLRRPIAEYLGLCIALLAFALLYISGARAIAVVVPLGMVVWVVTRSDARAAFETTMQFVASRSDRGR